MRLVTLDFETYYDKEYTLSKLTTEEYIRDPRFKCQGVGIKEGSGGSRYYPAEEVAAALGAANLESAAVVAHHAHFDGFILSHHYGICPRLWFDTLSMARALHGVSVGGSLAKLARHYGLGEKGVELESTMGKRDLTVEEQARLGVYCRNDVDLTHALFRKLSAGFPTSELLLIDLTVRLFTEPSLLVDRELLETYLTGLQDEKQAFLDRLGMSDRTALRSNPQFAALLKALGVEPPMKLSPTTGRQTFAFAKNDQAFKDLLEHETDEVRWLVEARLGVKSTLAETRTQRLMDAGARGPLPIYLNYYGAHTGRWSGGDKMNMQNLTRGSALRKCLYAPDGYVVVVADSSQIEARVLAWLAQQYDLVRSFAEGADVYSAFATDVYGRPITKADKVERFVGKVCVLGLGYGLGALKFRSMMQVGVMGGPSVVFSEEEAQRIVGLYRHRNDAIVRLWKTMDQALRVMAAGGSELMVGPLRVCGEGVRLPNGLWQRYPDLRLDDEGFSYRGRKERVRIYGGKLTENVVQALARIIVAEQMLRIQERYRVVTMTHDEVVCLAPEAEADDALAFMLEQMSIAPEWARGCPISAEGGWAKNYSK